MPEENDNLAKVYTLSAIVHDWREFLSLAVLEKKIKELRSHESNGRPLGSDRFVEKLEDELGRTVR